MILATAIRDGKEIEIPEGSLQGKAMDFLTFHRHPTEDEIMALLPGLAANDGKWRLEDGPWHPLEEIGKLMR